MGTLVKIILAVAAAYFAFKINIIFGFVFIAAVFLYLWFANYESFMAGRGNAEYNKENYDEAISYYKKAMKKNGGSFETRVGYASIVLRTGKPEEALAVVNEVLSHSGLKKDLINQAKQLRCLINYKLGIYQEAYEEALEIFEDGYTVSNTYCLVGLLMIACNEDPKKTLEFCTRAYDYDEDNRDIVDNYLISLMNMNLIEKAKPISEKLIEAAPTFVEAYYHSALLYNKIGDRKKASELLAKIPNCKRTYMTTVSEEEIEALATKLKNSQRRFEL